MNLTFHEVKIPNGRADRESPAGGLLLVHICVVCAAPLRRFSRGSPSREVMSRNAAAASRSAEQTPHQPLLPPPPPHLPASLPVVSLCSRATPAGGYWVTCHTQVLIYFELELLMQKKKRKVCLFLCVFMHERKKMKERLREGACDRKNSED